MGGGRWALGVGVVWDGESARGRVVGCASRCGRVGSECVRFVHGKVAGSNPAKKITAVAQHEAVLEYLVNRSRLRVIVIYTVLYPHVQSLFHLNPFFI